jgi:putative ABC transport system permease protein
MGKNKFFLGWKEDNMLFYIKLGYRNLLNNYRRSLKTILSIAIGLSACLLAQGFMSYTLLGLRESLINGGIGHIQIYQKGYLKASNDDNLRHLISDSKTVFRELSNVPGIKLFAPRINFQGMISSGDKSTIFMGTAGLPSREKKLNSLASLKQGTFLEDKKPFGIVIGSGLARKLHAGVGDTVTLMSTLKGGGVNAIDVEVIGIVEAQIKAYDDVLLLANLKTIQTFMDLPNSVSSIILLLNQTENLGKIEPSIQKICNPLGLEYRTWNQLAGVQYTQPKMFYDLIYLLIMIIIVLVVVLSIINTLNLTMQERVKEIGTIRSLGTTRLQVGKIFISESFLIGLLGGFFGIILGYALAGIFNALGGIPIPPPPGHAKGYTAFFKPGFIPALWLWMLFLMTATVGGFYPAFRAARLQIVEALRWI